MYLTVRKIVNTQAMIFIIDLFININNIEINNYQ